MRLRPFLLAFLGAAVVIAGSEVALREAEQHLPVLSEWPTAATEVKSAQYRKLKHDPSLLIVGSSMAELAIDPQQLLTMGAAPTAYNSALPFFTPVAGDVWLREFLKLSDDLDVLLVGLPVWPPPRDTASDPLALGLLRAVNEERATDPLDSIAVWRLRGLLADLDAAAIRSNSVDHFTDLGHYVGFYERSGQTVAGQYQPYLDSSMSDVQERALRRIIETALQAGATPVVLLEPGRFPDKVPDERVAAYINWLHAFTEDLGVEFWDSYSMEWDDSLWADEVHFNRAGTIAFTQYIGERLIELQNR